MARPYANSKHNTEQGPDHKHILRQWHGSFSWSIDLFRYQKRSGALSLELGYELKKIGVNSTAFRLDEFARLTNIMASHRACRGGNVGSDEFKQREIIWLYFSHFQKSHT